MLAYICDSGGGNRPGAAGEKGPLYSDKSEAVKGWRIIGLPFSIAELSR
jgi:hypothetical protein